MALVKIRNANDDGWIDIGGGVTIVQQDAEPAATYPGQLWLDTDGDPSIGNKISDLDGDTYVICEESSDEDIVRTYCNGTEVMTVSEIGIVKPNNVFVDATYTWSTPIPNTSDYTSPNSVTVVKDIHGAQSDTGSMFFIAPIAGIYLVTFGVSMTNYAADSARFLIQWNSSTGTDIDRYIWDSKYAAEQLDNADPQWMSAWTADAALNEAYNIRIYQNGGTVQTTVSIRVRITLIS
jgi:hypothetical protein